jgi:hypothetical protein
MRSRRARNVDVHRFHTVRDLADRVAATSKAATTAGALITDILSARLGRGKRLAALPRVGKSRLSSAAAG